jgi:adenine/guanine/hypoxanthine permease
LAQAARCGVSARTIAGAWLFGVVALLLALIPVVAISPILLYIGMLIGAQAFQTTPNQHSTITIRPVAAE